MCTAMRVAPRSWFWHAYLQIRLDAESIHQVHQQKISLSNLRSFWKHITFSQAQHGATWGNSLYQAAEPCSNPIFSCRLMQTAVRDVHSLQWQALLQLPPLCWHWSIIFKVRSLRSCVRLCSWDTSEVRSLIFLSKGFRTPTRGRNASHRVHGCSAALGRVDWRTHCRKQKRELRVWGADDSFWRRFDWSQSGPMYVVLDFDLMMLLFWSQDTVSLKSA